MLVIDLLNKIANNEEVPKEFKYRGKTYEAVKKDKFTVYKDDSGYTIIDMFKIFYLEACLNDEVEIIEEDKEIEPLKLNDSDVWTGKSDGELITEKINELVKAVNELKKGK